MKYCHRTRKHILCCNTGSEHFFNHDIKNNVYLSTDDGTSGIKGNLFEAVCSIFTKDEIKDMILYVCGPPRMMEAFRIFSIENKIKCYLALETIMACGIGICQGCTIEKSIIRSETNSYRNTFELACIDGPIFKANEVKTCLI